MIMNFITANWPAPSHISTVITTRQGGFSQSPWSSFNLATHVNDHLSTVKKNRQLLVEQAGLPNTPEWLNQTHSTKVVNLRDDTSRDADASFTQQAHQVAIVLTADCLPLLLCNKQGSEVAAIHAGWKGLLDGIVLKTIQSMSSSTEDLLVWLGPAISQTHFEVGAEVRQQFCDQYQGAAQHFIKNEQGQYMANLYALVTDQLNSVGIKSVFGGEYCSYSHDELFYSYRRDGLTGRMASLIWINSIT